MTDPADDDGAAATASAEAEDRPTPLLSASAVRFQSMKASSGSGSLVRDAVLDDGAANTSTALSAAADESSFLRRNRAASLPPQRSMGAAREDSRNHLALLVQARRRSNRYLDKQLGLAMSRHESDLSTIESSDEDRDENMMEDTEKEEITADSEYLKQALATRDAIAPHIPEGGLQRSISVLVKDFSYTVPVNVDEARIQTVANIGCLARIKKKTRDLHKMTKEERAAAKARGPSIKYILKDVNLSLEAGKMYLILGPPGSGKTSLLRAVAGLLPHVKRSDNSAESDKHNPLDDMLKEPTLSGTVTYNGLPMDNADGVLFQNSIAFIDQIDRHAPRLTVKETFDFSYQCKGGTHFLPGMIESPQLSEVIAKLDKEDHRVNLSLLGLGLDHVADTFVGNAEVRGVSGGQRRRVTVGEMMTFQAPVFCGDEISTGLDAASTYDIVNSLMRIAKTFSTLRVMSLLQPSPETFALFDEVVLLSEGSIVYAGPVLEAIPYFNELGFKCPETMDDADFLQAVATREDSADYYTGVGICPTPEELAQSFRGSGQGEKITNKMDSELDIDWRSRHGNGDGFADEEEGAGGGDNGGGDKKAKTVSKVGSEGFKKRYANNFFRSMSLNIIRSFTIWKRDIRFIRANAIKNVIMGVSVGGVFFQTDKVASIFGVLFQGMLFIMLGSMTSAPAQIDDRPIFYRHSDANFYPTASYVIGNIIALFPQTVMDNFTFGTILYWMVGLAPTAANYFIFMAVLLTFTVTMSQLLGATASFSSSKSTLQGISAVFLLLLMLFCGFIIAPVTIPNYYAWLYWWNPLAWAYRALIVNEFTSDKYSQPSDIDPSLTEGEEVMEAQGFVLYSGETFGREWIGYGFAYMIAHSFFCTIIQGLGLRRVRFESGASGQARSAAPSDEPEEVDNETFDLPFAPVDLTFKDLSYEVTASTGKEKLMLLNNVYGRLEPGRMCALMGSSGAGKTTLMDVIALRKTSGTITGEIKLNGHLQEENAFRRCSGYVYQFDQQTPELTVRETIMFSARLRLDPSISDEHKEKYVDQVIKMMELTPLKDTLVGDDDSGGLSFEQGKRLSIAVELAASPSIIFLDEPTSGLDSRAALIVMKSLKLISQSGRTVCATIHQPSSSVFGMFDDLLLMKKGGRVVYHGPLGQNSCNLIQYYESRGAAPINRGENPGTWMLSVITNPSAVDDDGEPLDFAEVYKKSDDFKALEDSIEEANKDPDEEKKIVFESQYAAPKKVRTRLVNERLVMIYWRSPTYNYGRLVLSLVIAFLLASVFVTNRRPEVSSETDITSIFSTVFISFIIIGVMSITTVLPVMLKIRDVYYLHRASGMLNHKDLNVALAVAEKRFICLGSAFFCCVFYFTIGFEIAFQKFLAFWGFFTFNLALYSYFGQAFMSCVRGMATAQILNAVFIGINNFFSGLIVRPQFLSSFFEIPYWITPGHYVYEGLIVSQFSGDLRLVVAEATSEYRKWLEALPDSELKYCNEDGVIVPPCPTDCCGTVEQFMDSFFGGKFAYDHILYDALVLGLFLVIARVMTYYSLRFFNYTST